MVHPFFIHMTARSIATISGACPFGHPLQVCPTFQAAQRGLHAPSFTPEDVHESAVMSAGGVPTKHALNE